MSYIGYNRLYCTILSIHHRNNLYRNTLFLYPVGYGDTSPETDGGKFLCIVYAFTSIPVTAVLMIGLGKKFYGMMKFIAQKIITNEEHESARLVLSLFLQLITGITSMTLLPAWIIAKYEGWSMVDSIYYNIVTLTTIGYGDFVVGKLRHSHFI